MDNVNKTLYIPLYGKALVSRMGIMLQDAKAEQLWEKAGITLKGKSASRYLAYSMAMRAVVFDEWTKQKISENPDGVVLHIGCGLDNRHGRIGAEAAWFDIDFPEVIRERKRSRRNAAATAAPLKIVPSPELFPPNSAATINSLLPRGSFSSTLPPLPL